MAIVFSVLYKTNVEPSSTFYEEILQDKQTEEVIQFLCRNRVISHNEHESGYRGLLNVLFGDELRVPIDNLKDKIQKASCAWIFKEQDIRQQMRMLIVSNDLIEDEYASSKDSPNTSNKK